MRKKILTDDTHFIPFLILFNDIAAVPSKNCINILKYYFLILFSYIAAILDKKPHQYVWSNSQFFFKIFPVDTILLRF